MSHKKKEGRVGHSNFKCKSLIWIEFLSFRSRKTGKNSVENDDI